MELNFLSRLAAFLVCFVAVIVAVNTFSLETITTTSLSAMVLVAGSSLTLLRFIHSDVAYRFNRNAESDRKLFEEFMNILSSDGATIRLLREHIFGEAFNRRNLDNLHIFLDQWHLPERKFHNKKLEKLKMKLFHATESFQSTLGETHFTLSTNPNLLNLYPELKYTKRDFWEEQKKKVNNLADDAHNLHQNFVATAKKELGI